jgi:hypothetical protein
MKRNMPSIVALALLLVTSPGPSFYAQLANSLWPMFRGNLRHAGLSAGFVMQLPGHINWVTPASSIRASHYKGQKELWGTSTLTKGRFQMRAATRCAVVALVAPVLVISARLNACDANAPSTVVLAGPARPGVELGHKNVVALCAGDTADSIKVAESSLIGWTHNLKTYNVSGKLPLLGDTLIAEVSNDSATGSASLKLWECGLSKSGSYELTGESPVFTLYPGGRITSADTGTALEIFMASPKALDPFMHLVVDGPVSPDYSYEVNGATPWWCGYALDIIVNNWNAPLTGQQQGWYHSILSAYLNNCVSSNSSAANR